MVCQVRGTVVILLAFILGGGSSFFWIMCMNTSLQNYFSCGQRKRNVHTSTITEISVFSDCVY